MKKTLLFLTFAILATTFVNAQSFITVNFGDFEDEVTNPWTLYGASYEIVENPLKDADNNSDWVLQNITETQYQGMSIAGLSHQKDSFNLYSFDVYCATGAVDFIVNVHGKTAEDADTTVSFYPTTTDGAWLHYEVDLTDEDIFGTFAKITQLDLQNNTAETELYWDNILLTSIYEAEPSKVITKANTIEMLLFPNPANCNDFVMLKGDIDNDCVVEIYSADGRLKLSPSHSNGLLNIKSLNSGLYIVKAGNQISRLIVK